MTLARAALSQPEAVKAMKAYRFILAGLGAAGALVAAILFFNQGSSPRIEGEILQVRTLGMDQNSSVAIVDFKGENTAKYPLIVGSRFLVVTDSNGRVHEGDTTSVYDLEKLFQYFPALGAAGNEPVIDKTRLEPGDKIQGMIAARFEIPKHELDMRRQITVRIVDVGDSVSEIAQENQAAASAGEAK